jgi:hypothetical protein
MQRGRPAPKDTPQPRPDEAAGEPAPSSMPPVPSLAHADAAPPEGDSSTTAPSVPSEQPAHDTRKPQRGVVLTPAQLRARDLKREALGMSPVPTARQARGRAARDKKPPTASTVTANGAAAAAAAVAPAQPAHRTEPPARTPSRAPSADAHRAIASQRSAGTTVVHAAPAGHGCVAHTGDVAHATHSARPALAPAPETQTHSPQAHRAPATHDGKKPGRLDASVAARDAAPRQTQRPTPAHGSTNASPHSVSASSPSPAPVVARAASGANHAPVESGNDQPVRHVQPPARGSESKHTPVTTTAQQAKPYVSVASEALQPEPLRAAPIQAFADNPGAAPGDSQAAEEFDTSAIAPSAVGDARTHIELKREEKVAETRGAEIVAQETRLAVINTPESLPLEVLKSL